MKLFFGILSDKMKKLIIMAKRLRQTALISGDIILAILALILTVRIGFFYDFSLEILKQHILPFLILYIFWFGIFYIFGLYELNLIRPNLEFLVRIGECFLVCLTVGMIFFYLIPLFNITPKTNLLLDGLLLGGLLLFWRRIFYLLFSSRLLQKVGFLGKNTLALRLSEEFQKNPQLGYKFIKFLDTEKNIASQIKKNGIETLIIAKSFNRNLKLTKFLYECLPLRVNLLDLGKAYEMLLYKIPVDFVNKVWILENLREGEKKVYDKLKRIGDVIFGGLIILITSPLWLIFAVLIKAEDKGPVFYRQKRVGKSKKEFWLLKFRTMEVDAEKKSGPIFAKKNDKRITKTGRFLRRTHLDEVPQMINVVKGDISLVGPRPERPEFVKSLEKKIPHYHLRHIIKPGFTGWAQTKKYHYARTKKELHEKFEYDLYYIKNRGLFLDIGIFLKSFQLFFEDEQK